MSALENGLADRTGYRFLHPSVQLYAPLVVVRPSSIVIDEGSRVDSFVKIEGGERCLIGKHVHISSFVHLNIGGGWLLIGDYVAITSGARVLTGTNVPEGTSMSSAAPVQLQMVKRKHTTIMPYAFVGTNAVVLPGVTLGVGAVLAAGAVATCDIPPGEVWMGVPAKKVRERDWDPAWGVRVL